jgi:uncharacterized membrane protein YphA (DoxX/SURF4 family)
MKRGLILIISYFFVILFLYSGASKLMEYSLFQEQIAVSPILRPISTYIAWILPTTEFLAAILLFFPKSRLKGLYFSLVLMILFTGYIIAILLFDKQLPCSCGGILESLSWKEHLAFNSICIAVGAISTILERSIQKESKQLFFKIIF